MSHHQPLPDWILERYRQGTLNTERRRQVERALVEDPQVAARLAALSDSDEEILRRYPPRVMRIRIEQALGKGTRRRIGGPVFGFVLAASAALLLARPLGQEASPDRIKGLRPQLQLFREGQPAPLGQGEIAHEGDVLQISFVRGEDSYGAILSIDGRGSVTVHAARLPPSKTSGAVALDQALQLDDAPSFERFFLVTGDSPVPLDTLTQAALTLAKDPQKAQTEPLPLPSTFHQTDRLLRKEDSP